MINSYNTKPHERIRAVAGGGRLFRRSRKCNYTFRMKINKVYSINNFRRKLGELTIGIAVDRFEKFSKENRKKAIYTSISTGICWEYHNQEGDLREVEIFEDGKNLFAYPSPDIKYMIVLFDRNSEYYPHPKNLVVFYPNGKIKHIVGLPELISEYAIVNTNNPMGVDKSGYFKGMGWLEKNEKVIMKVDIHFAWENTETREFNPETGEFGELIGVSGRS